ncbi:hypothetical protein NPIL_174921 [Nephila pilipes]|uniref:Uncharacterized protein n=1 Tax=Nephila pilipes TaxID=299642 RepID=A0A8X6TS50_NEPPI|nr:hypothetical protein NPIL_174921 [Nephila pilipes]
MMDFFKEIFFHGTIFEEFHVSNPKTHLESTVENTNKTEEYLSYSNHPSDQNKSRIEKRATYGPFIVRTFQSTRKNANCYRHTIIPILAILREHGLNFEQKSVDSTELSGWHATYDGRQPSKLYFKAALNMKHLLPFKQTRKRIFLPKKAEEIVHIFTSKAIYFDTLDKARLLIASKNFYKNRKSRIEILLEINSGRNFERNVNVRHQRNERIIDRLFQRDKRNIKSLKFQKFKAGSIYFGLFCATIASILCGLSFVLKKRCILRMEKKEAYYKNKEWWLAHSLMMIGDILHFVAFFFAPAVLVCVLQMLMILVTAFASSSILGEKINKYWKMAFATSLGGCLVNIVHVPREPHIYNIETFVYLASAPLFIMYNFSLLIVTIIMMRFLIPKWGQINSLAYTVQSAIFGSVVVVALKGVLLIFTDRLFHWVPMTCGLTVGICLLLQFEYLNRALHFYNTIVVTTQYYVLYSAFVIISLSLLFEVWKKSSDESILIIFLGCATTVMGVLIFAIFQEVDATFDFSKLFEGPEETSQ